MNENMSPKVSLGIKAMLIIGAVLLVIIGGLIFLLSREPTEKPGPTGIEGRQPIIEPDFKILRVEPLPDQKNVSTSPTIKIVFDKSVAQAKVEIISSPQAAFDRQLSPRGFTLLLTPQNSLEPSTIYTLEVVMGKTKIYSWSFTTGTKGADPQVLEKIKSKLPYQGENFRISYSATNDKFIVTITAKPVEIYKKKALDWFAAEGLPNAEESVNIFYLLLGAAAN